MYQPVISVKEARKKLGKKYATLSDSEVERIVRLLHDISKETILELGSKILF